MQLVDFNARQHYSEVRSWWNAQAWPPIEQEFLPQNGFVVEADGKLICAGWLYSTDSAFSWLEFIVGNPHISHVERGLGLDRLIQGAQARAKELGFKAVFMSVQNQRLIDRLVTGHGFVVADASATNLIWRS